MESAATSNWIGDVPPPTVSRPREPGAKPPARLSARRSNFAASPILCRKGGFGFCLRFSIAALVLAPNDCFRLSQGVRAIPGRFCNLCPRAFVIAFGESASPSFAPPNVFSKPPVASILRKRWCGLLDLGQALTQFRGWPLSVRNYGIQ